MIAAGDKKPVVCFGEAVLRLSPPSGTPLARTNALSVAVGGAEANVAVALAGLGWPARMLTVLPDNGLGRRTLSAFGEAGVDTSHVRHASGRLGLYFYETPSGPISGLVTYDRAGSAFANTKPYEIDFATAIKDTALLHVSGITPALGPGGVELIMAAVAAAKEARVPICVDGNYRGNLWDAWDGDARTIMTRVVNEATILIGNHRDISLLLGKSFPGDDPGRRREAAEAAFAAFAKLQLIASTARQIDSATAQRLAGRVDMRESHWQTGNVCIDPVVDRIGTGDAYAAGVLLRWLEGGSAKDMANTGLALATMKHGIMGDNICITRAELEAFDPAGTDVAR